MGKTQEAVSMLGDLLQISPTDAEAWAELADLNFSQNAYDQAIFCLEEVLLVMPNAWNIHARLAEVIYLSTIATSSEKPGELIRGIAEAMRRYCRSIELCNSYLRGFYGLKLVRNASQSPSVSAANIELTQTTKRLLELLPNAPKSEKTSSDSAYNDLSLPTIKSVERLHKLATSKLGEIIRRSASAEKGWDGYDAAEIVAARELLDRDSNAAPR
jgi:tetratricopeptide (TPR) repeat protein